jgi:hypothetical protein
MSTATTPSRPPWALTLIAAIGAALSFNAIRVMATPYAGFLGGIATALLFDAAMWLASRWYIDTVKTGQPLRPALALSVTLVGATLAVNVHGAHGVADAIVHGIGPALFAAFTWIEATIELRAYRHSSGARQKIPTGEKVVHPLRAARVWLMMIGTDTRSYTDARAMCQNREARRRLWAAEHRPGWLGWLRRARPGWRAKVEPAAYVAYRWGAFATTAHVIGTVTAQNTATGAAGNTLPGVPVALPAGTRETPDTVPGHVSGGVPGGVPGATADPVAGHAPDTPGGNARPRPARLPGASRGTASGTLARERGAGLPPGMDSGRDLRPEQVARLIRQGRAGVPDPSVRAVMEAFAVSYDKASKALELSRADVPPLHAVNAPR